MRFPVPIPHVALGAWVVFAPLVAQAPAGYQKPPKEVLEVLNAPLAPDFLVSADGRYALVGERNRYPKVADLAAPMLKLAGIRIHPKTNTLHGAGYLKNLAVRTLEGPQQHPVALPPNLKISNLRWNPAGTQIALGLISDTGMELWLLDPVTAKAKPIPGIQLNPLLGGAMQWLPDGETLLVKLVPAQRGAAPVAPDVPPGPKVLDTTGSRAASSTYEARDLMKTPHDADLFEYYTRSQL
ncbi:MAG: S9 family peptidase, partial [Firmicutes bacterium]|nr:S9 family peptidase [Bacillota bacterium]